jgi:RNA polymerase sigma-70 factor (ECF subfamily)
MLVLTDGTTKSRGSSQEQNDLNDGMKDDAGPRVNVPIAPAACRKTEVYPTYFAELYVKAGAEKLCLTFREFATILQDVSARSLAPDASFDETAAFHRSLRLEDLALARACAKGSESAWEYFFEHYRAKVYTLALGIAREASAALELADSLYSELFGTRQDAEGLRISKFNSYTGRGSIVGWLRAVLRQTYVDRYREERRSEPLDEHTQLEAPPDTDSSVTDPRLQPAIDAAWQALPAEERFILSCYYMDGRPLAETARLLGVHESTVSRRIKKITKSLQKGIIHELRDSGMNKREAEEALQTDVRDLALDLRAPTDASSAQ